MSQEGSRFQEPRLKLRQSGGSSYGTEMGSSLQLSQILCHLSLAIGDQSLKRNLEIGNN